MEIRPLKPEELGQHLRLARAVINASYRPFLGDKPVARRVLPGTIGQNAFYMKYGWRETDRRPDPPGPGATC